MTFNVIVLRRAEREFDSILSYLKARSPAGASRWLRAFESLVESLSHRPFSFPLAPENGFLGMEIRHALFKTAGGKTYRALFTIVANEVRILHVRRPGQDTLSPGEF